MPETRTYNADVIGGGLGAGAGCGNGELVRANGEIRGHAIERVGLRLRAYMTAMKPVV